MALPVAARHPHAPYEGVCKRSTERSGTNPPAPPSAWKAETPRDDASHPQVSLLPRVPGYRATDTPLLSIQRKVYRHTLTHLLRPFNLLHLSINGASNLNRNTHLCLIHRALWSLILLSQSWRVGDGWLLLVHTEVVSILTVMRDSWGCCSQLSQGCFASTEMALNGAGVQLGIFKKGRMQQGLRICKAVKHHCFFKKKKKNILSPRQVTEVQTWVPPLGTFSR